MVDAVTQQSRLVLALFLLPIFAVQGETFTGRVVRIKDGDTVEILNNAMRTTPVRVGGIDAPEKSQPFGAKSKQRLADLVGGKTVVVESHKKDHHYRVVGQVLLDGKDIGLEMVRSGLAWWYRAFSSEQSAADRALYETAENNARSQRLGLWADPDPMPPWLYRHQPRPPEGYAAHCPCGSGAICTGPKGGHFCVTEGGAKRYQSKELK